MPRYINPVPGYTYPPYGKLWFYKSGTNVLLNTFADEFEEIPNTNPVLLGALGRVPNIWYTGKARVVLQDALGEQDWERDPVGGGGGTVGDFEVYDSSISYDINDIAKTPDGVFYISLANNNQDNTPSTTPALNAFWMQVSFIEMHNSTKSYTAGNVVQTSQGYLWRSITSANVNNDPAIDDGTHWSPAVDGDKITAISSLTSFGPLITSSFTAFAGQKRQINATANAVNIVIPELTIGDPFTLHNHVSSTFKVQVLNPTQTISGKNGSIASGVNMEIAAGESVQLVAKSTTALTIVGALV